MKIHLISILFFIFCSVAFTRVKSQDAKNIDFIENKNQWNKNVLFKTEIANLQLYLEKNCFTYNYLSEEDLNHSHAHSKKLDSTHKKPAHLHCHAYKVKFINSLPDVKINSSEQTIDYCNYFIGNDKTKWASNVKKYKVVEYVNIYNNIDLKAYSSLSNFKYDFIIKPLGDVNDIYLNYDGANELLLNDGNLIIKTSINELKESTPIAYQIVNEEKVYIKCNYVLNNNNIKFELPDGYDKSKPLIIDPTLIFSTYTGSTSDNWGFTACSDNLGNVYSGGIVDGAGYPSSTGAYQIGWAGLWDIAIIKYNPTGTTRIYATYLGGSGCEMPHSIIANSSNELCIFGTTGSSNFPVTNDVFDQTFNGGNSLTYDNVITFPNGTDLFVSRLNANGNQLMASTLVGGSGNDGLNFRNYINNNSTIMMDGNDSLYYNYADGARGEIITDASNNVYIGTTTFSTNFPVSANAFQNTNSGKQEGIIFKLDYNLVNMIWGTYIGGTNDDAIYSVDVDANYDVYIGGGTNSTNFPTTAGVYQPTVQGGTADGFIAHFDYFGNLLTSTYFGSANYDQVYFVRTDKFKNVYVTGQTKAPSNSFIFNATYNTPNSGQFITKFDNSLSNMIWSTRFGTGNGKPNISITAFAVDICNRIYLAGWGREWAVWTSIYPTWASIAGTKNMDITPNAYQSVTDGQDFYIMVMKSNASSLDYGTFIGEQYLACSVGGHDHVDGGTSRFDKKGNIYQSICASCGGCNAFPTYPNPGAVSNTNNASNCNNAVLRFSFAGDFVIADFNLPPVNCTPATVNFTNTSLGTTYSWNFGDGTTSTATNPSHTYTQSGQYTVTLIATDTSTCNISDTITKIVSVLSNSTSNLASVNICSGQNYQIGLPPNADTSITYHWSPAAGLSDTTVSNPFTSATTTTTYLLVMSNGLCADSLYQTVNIMTISTLPDITICDGTSTTISVNNLDTSNILTYTWSPNIGSTNNPIVSPTQNTTYYVTVTNQYGCTDTDSIRVVVNELNTNISNVQNTLCFGSCNGSITISTNGISPISYLWSNGATTSNIINLCAGQYLVTVTDSIGCKKVINATISEPPQLLASTNKLADAICDSINPNIGSAIVNSSGGTPGYTYIWSNGQTTPTAINLYAIMYYVTVTDANGCDTVVSVQINDGSSLVADATNNVSITCFGDCDGGASTNIVVQSTPPYTYQWNTGATTPSITGLCSGIYMVSVVDANNCTRVQTVSVIQPDTIITSVNVNPIICNGGSATATANVIFGGTPPYTYSWNVGQSGSTLNNLTPGTYSVYVIDSHGCKDTTSLIITEPDKLLFDSTITPLTCSIACDGKIDLNINGGVPPYTYLWSNGSITNNINHLCKGNYKVTVTDKLGCSFTIEFSVEVLTVPFPLDVYADDYNIFVGETTNLHSPAIPHYIYRWTPAISLNNPNIPNPVSFPTETTTYQLEIIDENGCANIDTVTIFVEYANCGEPFIFVPNAFTPNGDNNNDILYVQSDIVGTLYFAVYDRWGEKVFESTDINFGWDGTFKGEKCEPAVFVYYLKALCLDKREYIKKGNVTLIR